MVGLIEKPEDFVDVEAAIVCLFVQDLGSVEIDDDEEGGEIVPAGVDIWIFAGDVIGMSVGRFHHGFLVGERSLSQAQSVGRRQRRVSVVEVIDVSAQLCDPQRTDRSPGVAGEQKDRFEPVAADVRQRYFPLLHAGDHDTVKGYVVDVGALFT